MKHLSVLLLACAAALPVLAGEDAERERIRAGRAAVEARFAEQERACRTRFAVTDCVEKATRERNAAVAELRRQERVLNEAERRRRAADKQKDLDERNSPERRKEAEARRARALEEHKERQERAAGKAQRRAEDEAGRARRGPRAGKAPDGPPGPQGNARAPRAPKAHGPSPEEAARNRAAFEARQKEAEAHRAQVRERIARRRKPAASDLPIPQ